MTSLVEEILPNDIERLGALQLTDLLRRLLRCEATAGQIPLSGIAVPLKITVSDEGEDGRIQWVDGPDHTEWVPNRFTLFQCKATDMAPADCAQEVLKPKVVEALDSGGAYVIFYGRSCGQKQITRRIKAMREALRQAGKPFADKADIQIYDSGKITLWVDQYTAAQVAVCKWIGRYLPLGISTWQEWKHTWDKGPSYITDKTIEAHLNHLRSLLAEPRRVARIIGLSGLGKSRLAFEAFHSPQSCEITNVQQTLADRIVYIRADQVEHPQSLPAVVTSWIGHGLKGIIVADECEPTLHKQLTEVVTREDSQFSLLTIDFNLEHSDDYIDYIELKRTSEEVIKGILSKAYPGLLSVDIDRIAKFAEGFPKMAVLLAGASLGSQASIANLANTELLYRLLFQREPRDSKALEVISALSLFTHVGFERKRSEEQDFVAKHICQMEPEEFHRLASVFIGRGILERKGDYVRVAPHPVAIRLAADWWAKASIGYLETLLKAIPEHMVRPLADQFAKLHFSNRVQDIVASLVAPGALFSRIETLNSVRGSQFLCACAEVNPKATVEALSCSIGTLSHEELGKVEAGRRHLVWALERLCFWAETFPLAARIMLDLASAENETCSNNATGQFLQLFHIYLSGTQAPPSDRLQVIDEALSSSEKERRVLGIKALGEALETSSFFREGGVEAQGSRPTASDWKPRIWGEIFDYWRGALKRLARVASGDTDESELARKQLVRNIRGLVNPVMLDELDHAFTAIIRARGVLWPDALESLLDTLNYEGPNLGEESKNWLNKWIVALQPNEVPGKLHLLVSASPFDYEKQENGTYVDLGSQRAQALADELASLGSTWYQHVHIIFEGEQNQGYSFGLRLGQRGFDPQGFTSMAIDTLRGLPKERANPIVLCGFLAGIRESQPGIVSRVLDTVALDDTLVSYLTDLTRRCKPVEEDLERLIKQVDDGRITVQQLGLLAYGSVLNPLKSQVVMGLCNRMLDKGVEGAATALHILFMYCFNDAKKQISCRATARRILMTSGLLSYSRLDSHSWEQESLEILQIAGGDLELASHLVKEIIEFCTSGEIYRVDDAVVAVLREAFAQHPEELWPMVGEGLTSGKPYLAMQLGHLLESPSPDRQFPVVLSVPIDVLLNWAAKDKGSAVALSRIMPLFESDVTNNEDLAKPPVWTPLASAIIDNFGGQSEVLAAIGTNMRVRSFSGSQIPYFRRDIEAFKQLLTHSLPQVRAWAKDNITGLGRQIVEEGRRDEEHELGVW